MTNGESPRVAYKRGVADGLQRRARQLYLLSFMFIVLAIAVLVLAVVLWTRGGCR